MSEERSVEDLEAALDQAISELVVPSGDRLSRFALVVETIDLETGGKAIIVDNADGMMPWDVIGMLQWGQDVIAANDEEDE